MARADLVRVLVDRTCCGGRGSEAGKAGRSACLPLAAARTLVADCPLIGHPLVHIYVAGALLVHTAAEHARGVAHLDVADGARPPRLTVALAVHTLPMPAEMGERSGLERRRGATQRLQAPPWGRTGSQPRIAHLQSSMHSADAAARQSARRGATKRPSSAVRMLGPRRRGWRRGKELVAICRTFRDGLDEPAPIPALWACWRGAADVRAAACAVAPACVASLPRLSSPAPLLPTAPVAGTPEGMGPPMLRLSPKCTAHGPRAPRGRSSRCTIPRRASINSTLSIISRQLRRGRAWGSQHAHCPRDTAVGVLVWLWRSRACSTILGRPWPPPRAQWGPRCRSDRGQTW